MKKAIALILALTLSLGLVACGGTPASTAPTDAGTAQVSSAKETEKPLHFVYVSPLLSHPIWLIAKEGFDNACKELGVTGDWVGPQGVSAEEMAQLVDTAVAQKADGIITQSICPAAPINTAISAKIPIILVDGDLADVPDKLAFLGKDLNKQAELFYQEACKYVAQDEKIVASIQCAALNAQIYVDQNKAIEDVFSKHPGGFELVSTTTSNSDKATATTEWQNTLNTYPEINVAINVAGEAGPACAGVVAERGEKDKITILAVDNMDETIDLIASGAIDGTVVSSFYNYGYQAAYWLYQNITEGRTPETKTNDAGTYMVNKENLETYGDLLKQKVDLPA
ncbi:MAG: substrate-binding domain-containing protein [Ruthenibacterium sp.]